MYLVTSLVSFTFLFMLLFKHETRTPIFLFFLIWSLTLSALLLLQPFVQFEFIGTFSVDVFMALSLLFFGIGFQLFKPRLTNKIYLIDMIKSVQIAKFIICVALVGIASNLGMFIDKFLFNGGSIDLEAIRSDASGITNKLKSMSILQEISTKLLPFSLLSIISLPFLNKRTRISDNLYKLVSRLAIANALLMCLTGIFVYGGRMNIAIAILGYWISNYFLSDKASFIRKRKSIRFKKVAVSIVSILIVTWLSTKFIILREGEFRDIFIMYHNLMRMELMPYLQNLIYEYPTIGLLLLSLGYFVSPIPSLDYYMNVGDIPGPFFGGYNFPIVFRNFTKLPFDLQSFDWHAIRDEVFWPFVGAGYLGNVWSTLFRDFAVDFTLAGCIVFMFVLGAVVAQFFGGGQRSNFLSHIFAVLLSIVLVFSPFTSLFPSVYISYGILYILLAWIYLKLAIPNLTA